MTNDDKKFILKQANSRLARTKGNFTAIQSATVRPNQMHRKSQGFSNDLKIAADPKQQGSTIAELKRVLSGYPRDKNQTSNKNILR